VNRFDFGNHSFVCSPGTSRSTPISVLAEADKVAALDGLNKV
jgi:hypothetical protein